MNEADQFDSFYLSSRSTLLRQMVLVLGDIEQARDVTQDAYVKAWKHWAKVGQLDNPETWVRRVALNTATSGWRRRRVAHEALPLLIDDPLAKRYPSEQLLDLVSALQRLPVDQRIALVLHELADMTVEQVAKQTNAPVGTVKARLSRGRAALAEVMAGYMQEETT